MSRFGSYSGWHSEASNHPAPSLANRAESLSPPARGMRSLCLAFVLFAMPLPKAGFAQEIAVNANLPTQGFIDPRAEIRLTLDRPLAEGEHVAVFVGAEDLTSLFTWADGALAYQPRAFTLPGGEQELRVFLVSAEEVWREVARFDLRVRGALGFEERRFVPGLELGLKAQPAEGHDPDESAPLRETFGDVDGEARLRLEQVHSTFALSANAKLLGTSYRNNALRFQREGEEAPLVDLASYDLGVQSDPVSLTIGHIQYGTHRYLANGINARGARLDLAASRLDASFAASSANQIVGWDDVLGITDPDNRILSANVGVEAFETPGTLRLDAGWMNGSLLPSSSFNQGVVNDAEESDGFSFRLRANALDRRLRLDAGYASSRFTNPEDPLLSQGQELIPVEETRNDARYIDANVDVLRNLSLGGSTRARLSVGYRHERVDPLYRSIGAYARSDQLNNQFDVRADIAWVTLGANYGRSRNNLDDIPSILTSKTNRSGLNVGLPLTRASRWLPSLRYRLDRTHQFGEGVPENGGFNESQVPDQVSLNHTAGLDWRWSILSVGLQFNLSDQDNRQPGREDADFVTRRNAVSLGIAPLSSLTVGLDLALESRDDKAADVTADTRRWGVQASWQPLRSSALSLNYSDTFQDDDADTFESSSRILNVGWTSFLPFVERFGGQYFVRFNRQSSRSEDFLRSTDLDRMNWTLNFGLGITLGGR